MPCGPVVDSVHVIATTASARSPAARRRRRMEAKLGRTPARSGGHIDSAAQENRRSGPARQWRDSDIPETRFARARVPRITNRSDGDPIRRVNLPTRLSDNSSIPIFRMHDVPRHPTRREFIGALAVGSLALVGCQADTTNPFGGGVSRLAARPGAPAGTITAGSWPITASNPADGYLIVPSSYDRTRPMPFVLGLHGAGIGPQGPINLLGPYAESAGFILLAVGARGLTWDVLTSKFSYDVSFIDAALKWSFDRCAVDPARVVVQGFRMVRPMHSRLE